MIITLEQLVDAAKEAEEENPIPWEHLGMDRELVYFEVADQMAERFANVPPDARVGSLLATVVFLTVQNWVLETKLGLMD